MPNNAPASSASANGSTLDTGSSGCADGRELAFAPRMSTTYTVTLTSSPRRAHAQNKQAHQGELAHRGSDIRMCCV